MNKILNKNFVEGGAVYCGRFKKDVWSSKPGQILLLSALFIEDYW